MLWHNLLCRQQTDASLQSFPVRSPCLLRLTRIQGRGVVELVVRANASDGGAKAHCCTRVAQLQTLGRTRHETVCALFALARSWGVTASLFHRDQIVHRLHRPSRPGWDRVFGACDFGKSSAMAARSRRQQNESDTVVPAWWTRKSLYWFSAYIPRRTGKTLCRRAVGSAWKRQVIPRYAPTVDDR